MEKTQRRHWTKESCKEEALKYQSRNQFRRNCQSAYQKAYMQGWLDEICEHMVSPIRPSGYWTKERCAKEALHHMTRYSFQQGNPSAYNKARHKGWLDEICEHMNIKRKYNDVWTRECCRIEALKYTRRETFKKRSNAAFYTAERNGWLDAICKHMKKKKSIWTKEECLKIAMQYTDPSEFKRHSRCAFNSATRNGWIDEINDIIENN